MKNNFGIFAGFWPLLMGLIIVGAFIVGGNKDKKVDIPVSVFKEQIDQGRIKEVTILPGLSTKIEGKYQDGTSFSTVSTASDETASPSYLSEKGVKVKIETEGFNWWAILSGLLPIIITFGIIWFLFRGVRGNEGAMSFARSKAKLAGENSKVLFKDVAGCDEAKAELVEVVDFLKDPARFHSIGARVPRGCLLFGPPGSGKTLLAKAVAGEAGVPFFSISGSDFVEMFVGVGAARVRDLFEQARRAAPAIIFIDEIDAVGKRRGQGYSGGNDEREQTLNQLLVELDGFETTDSLIVIAATNRPDVLDPALLRPGRFDRQVTVDMPDVKGREAILRVHAKKKPLDETVDLKVIAKRTPGFVGAELENLLNEAALLAARSNRKTINMFDLDEAADRVIMGPERRSRVISDKDRRITAFHEVGHALAANLLPDAERVHKITIVPRGRAAGYMLPLPSEDMHWSRSRLLARIAVSLAGRVAEEIVFGDVTTGAQNDFQQATGLARKMVTEWGMSEKIGPLALNFESENIFERQYSEATAQRIDNEIRSLIEDQYKRVYDLLNENRERMNQIVELLIERETMTGEEFDQILQGQNPNQAEVEEENITKPNDKNLRHGTVRNRSLKLRRI